MKYIRIFIALLFFVPVVARAATNEFMVAAQLLAAARNADIQQVQALVNNGADVNFVDSTGLSIVCTALMNNDMRAAQILQMYGADASKCDQQIKQYQKRNEKERSGGLFSGLSSAHTLTLAAAGAAVVVGGLLLLTDVFGGGNHNDSGGGSGDRPSNGGDGSGNTGTSTALITVPYGPAMPNAESESQNYTSNLNLYSSDVAGNIAASFALMNNWAANADGTNGQNYLLMMRGYSPMARGYMGMRTLRMTGDTPVPATDLGKINIKGNVVEGGRPTAIGLITANGVNAAPKPAGEISAEKNSLDDKLLFWTTVSGNVVNENPEISNVSSKYYNNKITYGGDGAELDNSYTSEDANLVGIFDVSNSGTAVSNTGSSALDNMLAKVVGGADTGYANADYLGFMPNGQMGIFRTGGGYGFTDVANGDQVGTYTTFETGETIVLNGKTLTLAVDGNAVTATGTDDDVYSGYIGADGLLYIADTAGGAVSSAYKMANGNFTLAKTYGEIDYMNYRALRNAAALWIAGDLNGGRSMPDVIANASVISPLHSRDAATIDTVLVNPSKTSATFSALVNQYYDRNDTDASDGSNALPGTDAASFFNGLGSTFLPLVMFSTGAAQTNSSWSDATLVAGFENAAPLVYDNLSHLFMSIVAVGMTGAGTTGTKDVAGYNPAGKFVLSKWSIPNGDAPEYYQARACGIAGRGSDGIDPWCFAAAGTTDELAVASAAGAVGVIKSAFSYMNNKMLFSLMALTADGPYLGTTTGGTSLTQDSLISYLKAMYDMPGDYQYRWENGGENYLDVFKEVFGYGLINLERATQPGNRVYFYDATNGKIVTASGNAYWRSASKTAFRTSAAFNPRAATISAPFFDVIESTDGELRLPRVWENKFAMSGAYRRGMYMGDVYSDLQTRVTPDADTYIGPMHFSMAVSPRLYDDNMGGLDYMRFGLTRGDWDLTTGYQHRFTDGARMMTGMANPVLSLASDAIDAGATFRAGNWTFGGRAFSGAVTDSELLENDPTITSRYTPARLGLAHGGAGTVGFSGARFALDTSVGMMRETDTVLGAQTGGLLNLGGADTTYVDVHGRYNLADDISVQARATFAHTVTTARGEYILGMTDVDSNAFALGANVGNFEFVVSQPLAARDGVLRVSHAEYDVVETDNGMYDLEIGNTGVQKIGLRPTHRELRLATSYRHAFGEFTDGAIGFIYRVNPNNTDEFGNETIFMLKLSHRMGI